MSSMKAGKPSSLKRMERWSSFILACLVLAWASCKNSSQNPASPGPHPGLKQESPSYAKVISLNEIFGAIPTTAVPTSSMVQCRKGSTQEDVGIDVEIITDAGENYCVDGLRDKRMGIDLMKHDLSEDERQILTAGGSVVQRVHLSLETDKYISAYIGQSSYTPGAAHASNGLGCATFDRSAGARMDLGKIIRPEMAMHVIAKVQKLLSDSAYSIEALGSDLSMAGGSGYSVSEAEFLLRRNNQFTGETSLEVVLCAQPPHALEGTILEISLDDLPVSLLLN
jgi:hypothetical protein